MARTNPKWIRVYVDGYDLSGDARAVGALDWTYDTQPEASFTDEVKNVMPGQATLAAGPINAIFNNTATTGFHVLFNAQPTSSRTVTIVQGVNAAPAAGDPVYSWTMKQTGYNVEQGAGFVAANLTLTPTIAGTGYSQPWGVLLHAKGAETGANTAAGIDDYGQVSTTNGGIFIYQLFTSNGTVTLKAQDAATNSNVNFADITGATSGLIDATTTPVAGIVQLTEGGTIRRYLRWQLALGSATTVTFAMAFIRHYTLT